MTFQVILFTIIEMHITEEYTNSHGFRRFAPESTNESHVSICYAATALKYLNVLIIIHLYWKTYVQLKFCNLEAIQTVWNMDDTSGDGP